MKSHPCDNLFENIVVAKVDTAGVIAKVEAERRIEWWTIRMFRRDVLSDCALVVLPRRGSNRDRRWPAGAEMSTQ